MRLHTVTISGADDSTPTDFLVETSCQFPFIEWGILLSSSYRSPNPKPRYPTLKWLDSLLSLSERDSIRFSGHICGKWAKNIYHGVFPEELFQYLNLFQRIQLNIAAFSHKVGNPEAMAAFLPKGFKYILQVGNSLQEGITLAKFLQECGLDISILFDSSGGRGVTPENWPAFVKDISFGFAGGISPDNIATELSRMALLVGDSSLWIDMESKVRTDDKIDPNKVRYCLKIASKYWSVLN